MTNKKHILLFILIIAVFLFAFLYMAKLLGNENLQSDLLKQFLVNLPACILIGIIDFYIINTTYKKIGSKHNVIRIFIDLVSTASVVVLLAILANYIIFLANLSTFSNDIGKYLPLILWNSMIVLLIEIFFYNQQQIESERKLALIEKEKLQYQYEMLKAQINPHFLFNSLNVLSSLAYTDAEKANLFAKKMSGVYRYLLLTNERQAVTLKEELLFVESYLFLEQIRFENALFVHIISDDTYMYRKIIPVSIQLLVENAVKHNITTVKNPLIITIQMTGEGVIVSNNLQRRSSVDKGGMGLKNLEKQYALLHKTIEVVQTDTDYIVKIPFAE